MSEWVTALVKITEWLNNLQCLVKIFVDFHDSCLVAASIAVVRGGKNSYHIHHMRPIIPLSFYRKNNRIEQPEKQIKNIYHNRITTYTITTYTMTRCISSLVVQCTYIHDKLVCPRDQREAVAVVEHLGYIAAEGVPGAPRGYAPALAVVGVRPEEVAHRALVRDLLHSVQLSDVVQRVDGRGEAA
jgi:hypothetical protein